MREDRDVLRTVSPESQEKAQERITEAVISEAETEDLPKTEIRETEEVRARVVLQEIMTAVQ